MLPWQPRLSVLCHCTEQSQDEIICLIKVVTSAREEAELIRCSLCVLNIRHDKGLMHEIWHIFDSLMTFVNTMEFPDGSVQYSSSKFTRECWYIFRGGGSNLVRDKKSQDGRSWHQRKKPEVAAGDTCQFVPKSLSQWDFLTFGCSSMGCCDIRSCLHPTDRFSSGSPVNANRCFTDTWHQSAECFVHQGDI